ncbi:MAG: peptidoglycan DD-metalloendopeptidase family protein, partial [Anaerolineae bacterium]
PTVRTQDTPSPTPAAAPDELVLGHSVEGRPIVAYRFGTGPIKVALVGDIHGALEANTHELAQLLRAHFQDHPDEVPADVSLWIVPTMNPDGLATGHRWNANDVDLNRNADTDLDGCAGNDWSRDTVGYEGSHPGAGGTYPFSEPESVAVRDFLDDAWIAIFYHSEAEAIYRDSCQRHAPTARLAALLSEATGYPVPEEGWVGYPITGDFGDYLAGEGVASVTVELADHDAPEFERNLAGVHAVLAAAEEIVTAGAAAAGADSVWLDEEHAGAWRYPTGTFVHPIALELAGDTAYLLDGGRVLALSLDAAAAPRVLLAPGDYVGDVRVLEPLDLAVAGTSLLVLDRAGDVYRYDPPAAWRVERYDRPAGDTYDHYYVALAAGPDGRYLLETTHEEVWRYTAGSAGSAWTGLPKGRDVDLSAGAGAVYVLTRALNSPAASLLRFPAGAFDATVEAMHPRQLVATGSALYVLDRAGRRLLALDPASGALDSVSQFPDRRAVSAVWAGPSGDDLILAGRDALYFPGQPGRTATVDTPGGTAGETEEPRPHDPAVLEALRSVQMPIAGARVTSRDFQMPGAPRHYRLGVHEGVDFYGHTVGVAVERGTPVRAVAGGIVVRALVDYEPLTAARSDAWYDECRTLGYTPPDVLDGYRGRQVWIDHGNGLVSRYAHLDSIEPGIVEGAEVEAGQVIARVGNSGTPASVNSATYDAHLHLELWIGDHYAGQFLRPIEARTWLERILQ